MTRPVSEPPCVNAPWFLLAPGAGAGSGSPWMVRWRSHLETLGQVSCFDYPYMQAGKRRPDPLPRLLEAHAAALTEAAPHLGGRPVLVGKSMGGRVGCHLSLSTPVSAVICLGYPLVSPSRVAAKNVTPSALRDQVLVDMRTPVLFVQGTRDPLCPLDWLESTRARMQVPSELHVVPTGDHSLLATKTHLARSGTTQEELEREVVRSIAAFLKKAMGFDPSGPR